MVKCVYKSTEDEEEANARVCSKILQPYQKDIEQYKCR